MKLQARGGDYEDVVASIQAMETIDLDNLKPDRQRSTLPDPEDRRFQQEVFIDEHKAKLRIYETRQENLRKNLKTAYAIIYEEFCTKTIQDRIQALPDMDTFEGDPIELLVRIRSVMEDNAQAQYDVLFEKKIIDRFNCIKQEDEEKITDYARRYKQIRDTYYHEVEVTASEGFAMKKQDYKALTTAADRKKHSF